VFSAGVIHALGNLGPLQAIFIDQLEKPNVFLHGPVALVDVGIEVIVPFLTAVVEVPEELAVRPGKESVRDAFPVNGFIFNVSEYLNMYAFMISWKSSSSSCVQA
jgi:hypothetical protein